MSTKRVSGQNQIASGQVSRREIISGLALALVGLTSSEVLAGETQRATEESPSGLGGKKMAQAVRHLNSGEVLRTIRNAPEEKPGQAGLYSLRFSTETEYPVIGVRRTVAGNPEIHQQFLDVQFVLEGSATLVTGGTVSGGAETAPGEIRGGTISGGETRRVKKGDFLVIPQGVPHWVKTLNSKEFLYIVVKVPAKR